MALVTSPNADIGEWHHIMPRNVGEWHRPMSYDICEWHHLMPYDIGEWHHLMPYDISEWHHLIPYNIGEWHHLMPYDISECHQPPMLYVIRVPACGARIQFHMRLQRCLAAASRCHGDWDSGKGMTCPPKQERCTELLKHCCCHWGYMQWNNLKSS